MNFQEVEQLRQDKLEIDQQLRSLHGSTTGQMPSFQSSRRGTNSGGVDEGGSVRGGRGGLSRGRGRGRMPVRHTGNDKFQIPVKITS